MLRAIRDYGLYFGDTGGGWISFESGTTYTSFGASDPLVNYAADHISEPSSDISSWLSSDGHTDYAMQLVKGVDWSHLQVVDPCVIARSC